MDKIVSIDKKKIDYFQSNWSREFRKEDEVLANIRGLNNIKPTKHAADLRYYPFTWGIIVERRTIDSILWDICLHRVQKITNAQTIRQVKKHIFVILEKLIPDYTDEEPIYFSEKLDTWAVYPGATFSEITVAFRAEKEESARQWMGEVMIATVIGQVLEALYIHQNIEQTPLTA